MKIELTEEDIDLILESIACNVAEEQQYIEMYQNYRPKSCQYTKMYIEQLEDIRYRLMKYLGNINDKATEGACK